ncbi:MAG: transposase [Deltaproteobacteria bacterium]|nr:transposase [Deltaproteobacteria bacterium]
MTRNSSANFCIGRYTHRIVISNHRIKSIDNDKVVFTYKDRGHGNTTKQMTPDAMEFIRRFLLHVLPNRFMKIRYYGFLANTNKRKAIMSYTTESPDPARMEAKGSREEARVGQ